MYLVDHLDKIRAFQKVAISGTIRDAAIKLNVSQPSLTRLIQTLENACGTVLLQRSRRGVQLTQSGRLLLEFANITLKNLEDFEAKLAHPSEELSGHLKIGSYESLAEYLWPDFIASMKKEKPSLQISIETNRSRSMLSALRTRDLDLLIDAEPQITEEFTSWKLYSDKFKFYVKKGTKSSFSPDDIRDIPLIFVPSAFDSENRSLLSHVEQGKYHFREKIILDSFTASRTFCNRGLGIAILPEKLAQDKSQAQKLSEATLRGFSRSGFGSHKICATILSGNENDPRIKYIIKSLRKWFKE